MILNPKTSQETLNKYPDEEARMAAQQRACIMGGMALVFLDTLTSMFMAGYTLKAPPNQGLQDFVAEYVRRMTASIRAVIGPQATCATCALARPCGDDNSRLCGTDNIIRGVDFYCSNAIRRKDGNDD